MYLLLVDSGWFFQMISPPVILRSPDEVNAGSRSSLLEADIAVAVGIHVLKKYSQSLLISVITVIFEQRSQLVQVDMGSKAHFL